MKNSTDADESDFSDSYSHQNKKSAKNQKKNQNRIVKFTNSTKGGDSPYTSRMKNEYRLSQNEEKSKDKAKEDKRKLRSRSKK